MTSTSNINLSEELKDRIRYSLKQVVSQKHPEPNKKLLKDMHGRITLACPYCGDSHTDDTKKRGNIFWDTLQYHCYNCSHHTNVYTFLKDPWPFRSGRTGREPENFRDRKIFRE